MFAELLRAPLSRLVMFLCVISLCSCPGALLIWLKDPTQFKAFNSFQLILLSVALILPFILLNACVVSWSFGIHRWVNRYFRHRNVRAPREAVVAAASVFAGAVASVIPAYAPILAYVFYGGVKTSDMLKVALFAELIPLGLLLLVNPINYWQGADEKKTPTPEQLAKQFQVNLVVKLQEDTFQDSPDGQGRRLPSADGGAPS